MICTSTIGRAPDTALVVLYALLNVVDVASRALAPWLSKARAARLDFLRVLDGPAVALSPLLVLLGTAAALSLLLGDQLGLGLALVAVGARMKSLQELQKSLAAEGRKLAEIAADQRTDEQKARLAWE